MFECVKRLSAETALRHFDSLLRTGRGNQVGETIRAAQRGGRNSAQLRFDYFHTDKRALFSFYTEHSLSFSCFLKR